MTHFNSYHESEKLDMDKQMLHTNA